MFLVFVSIPLMVLAVAMTLVPLIVAMAQESAEQRRANRPVELPRVPAGEIGLAA